MFRLLGHLIPRILALALLLVTVVLVLWHDDPPPLVHPGFDVCALPCWGGILPGATRYEQASAVLATNLNDARLRFQPYMSEVTFWELAGAGGVFGAVYDDRGIVGGVRLDFSIPLWHLLSRLGSPLCVHRSIQGVGVNIYSVYWQVEDLYMLGMVLLDEPADWRLERPVNMLFIYQGADPCTAPGTIAWRGFGAHALRNNSP
jgi:hypothetical protein